MISLFLRVSAPAIPPPPTDTWSLIQYGIVGVLALALISRRGIVPEWILKRDEVRHAEELAAQDKRHQEAMEAARAQIKSLESQVERLQDVTLHEMIPALTRATAVAATYNEELARQRHRQGASGGHQP